MAPTVYSPSQQLREKQLVKEICLAPNALEARRRFEKNVLALKDWQIIFAEESDRGSFKLLNKKLGAYGLATSIFRGKSLWIMNADFVTRTGPMDFCGGSAMFVDSNVASYIRTVAYDSNPSKTALSMAKLINEIHGKLQQLNPNLYLWEALRSWNKETAVCCKQSLAAMHALSYSGSKLTEEWGLRYRSDFREVAENFATGLLVEFERDVNAGKFSTLDEQLALIEVMLLRVQIIELSSKKSRAYKLTQLINYMHEELATMLYRELIVCGDILNRNERSRIFQKLNSIQNTKNPLALIKNCAWDMYIPRALDALTAITPNRTTNMDFYVAEILTFDGDVSEIMDTTKLRAIAVHRPSGRNYPFLDKDVPEWLGNYLDPKRMDAISDYFLMEAYFSRAIRRPSKSVRSILESSREELMMLIHKIKSNRSRS